MKKVLYVDMDCVLVDFESEIKKFKPDYAFQFEGRVDEIPNIFKNMDPIFLAENAFAWLSENFDTYFLSTAPWENPSAWSDKLNWVKKHIGPEALKRLIITHHKNLLKGDFIIDDNTKNGDSEFVGKHIHFGQGEFTDWDKVISYLRTKLEPSVETEVPTDKNKKEAARKEAARKKSLGELGELVAIKALCDAGFDKIQNLNDVNRTFPFADIYCEKGGEKFIISVKARNMYQKDKSLNKRYKLGGNAYKHAVAASESFKATAYWMAIQFTEYHYSIYFDSLEALNGRKAIPIDECMERKIGKVLESPKELESPKVPIKHYFDFDYFKNF